MGITFRHDASAVGSVPSGGGGSRRKYGYDLVSQQMQQKYDSYQRGMDRWYDAAQNRANNNFQLFRDTQQNHARAAQMEQDFRLGEQQRQNTFDREQQAAAAAQRDADFRAARDTITNHAQAMLDAGEIPPDLVPKVRNLIKDRMTVLTGPWDDVQRKEFLDGYNAQLAAILSQAGPQPSEQDKFAAGIVTDPKTGIRYRQDGRGNYQPIEEPPQPQRPLSAQEYYDQNEDQFNKDLQSKMASMQDEVLAGTRTADSVTPQAAWEEMQKDYNFRQQALGRVGQPTAAPSVPGAAPAATPPMQSILEGPQPTAAPAIPSASTATPPMSSILENPDPGFARQGPESPNMDPGFAREPALAPPSNPWSDAVLPEEGIARPGGNTADAAKPEGTPTPAPKQERKERDMEAIKLSGLPEAKRPNFNKLEKEIGDEEDKALIRQVRVLASQGYPPDVTNALYLILDPNASPDEAYQANAYLLSKGIDINQIASPPAEKPFHSNKNRDWQSGRGL